MTPALPPPERGQPGQGQPGRGQPGQEEGARHSSPFNESTSKQPEIPRVAHFIWLGPAFHWVYGLAARSAALRGGFERVLLHHTDDLSGSPGWSLLRETPGIEPRLLKPVEWLERVPGIAAPLLALYERLRSPEAKANVLRVALLYGEGGIYLDTDTLTLRPFGALFAQHAFCGLERIVLPGRVVRSRDPGVWLRAGALLFLRDVCRRLPHGWRAFQALSPWYALAANNAILGARPAEPFYRRLLEAMVELAPERQLVRYALGPRLLDELIEACDERPTLCPPETFYPLPPEISQHWFRRGSVNQLQRRLVSTTVCAHWYASVRTRELLPRIDAAYVRAHAAQQLFSALALPFLEGVGP